MSFFLLMDPRMNSQKHIPRYMLLFVIMAFFSRLFFVSGIFVPFFLEWGQITMQQVMQLQSWFMFWVFIFEVPSGSLADYLGRKIALIVTFGILILAIAAYGILPNFYMFLLAEFLWALAVAMLSGTFQAFVYDSLKAHGQTEASKPVFALIESIMLVANFISTPIGGLIATTSSPQYAMLISAIPTAIALVLACFLKEPRLPDFILNHDGQKQDMEINVGSDSTKRSHQRRSQKKYIQILKDGFHHFRTHKILRMLAFEAIAFQVVGYYLRWYYQAKLLSLGVDVAYLGIIHTVILGLQILLMSLIPWFERRLGSKKAYLVLSPIILGIGYILATFSVIWLVILGSIFGIAMNNARKPVLDSYMNKFINSEERATIISVISMIRQACLMLLNLVLGYVGENYLNYMFIGLGILSFILLLFSQIEEKHLLD